MRSRPLYFPFLIIALVWAVFAGFVVITAVQMPERVATHFGLNGLPNGWMSRSGHVQFTLFMGLLVPSFVLGIFSLMGRFPGQALNISHQEYWFAPERREATLAFVQRQGLRFASMFIVFLAGIHWSILTANRHQPAVLPGAHVGWISGIFLAACAAWVGVFILHFSRRPA